MAAPKTTITQVDGQLGTSSPSGRRPVILLGAASDGPIAGADLVDPIAYMRPNAVVDEYGTGPLVEACKLHLSYGTPVIPIRCLAEQTGSCSAIDATHITGQEYGI